MPAYIDIQARDRRVAEAVRNLEALSAAEKKMAANAAGLGRATQRAGKQGDNAFKAMTAGAVGAIGALTGVASVAGLIQTAMGKAREDFEKLREYQRGAAESQQTMAGAIGEFISNNPQLAQNQVQNWVD